jgi:predicted AAA+ superfamily ATPase
MEDSTPDGIKNYLINFLLIKSGVNIIFGAKRTGKTEILKHINNKTKNNNSYYESSYRNEAIKELKTKLFNEDTFINQKNE